MREISRCMRALLAFVLIVGFSSVTAAIDFSSAKLFNSTPASLDEANDIYAIDLDQDGDYDVIGAVGGLVGNGVYWWENDGNQNFTQHAIDTGMTEPVAIYADDVDDDGDIDVLAADYNDLVCWWANDGSENFGTRKTIIASAAFGQPRTVQTADIDGDNDLDVISASREDDTVSWFENDGGSPISWTQTNIDALIDRPHWVRAADMDNDGDTDVVAASYGVDGITWWENVDIGGPGTGNGTSWTQHAIDTGFSGYYCAVADLDGDGDEDVLGAEYSGDEMYWYDNTAGDGTAWTKYTISAAASVNQAWGIDAADLDGDGDLDVFGCGRYSGEAMTWWTNDGTPANDTWASETVDATGNYNGDAGEVSVDLDNDGDYDILAAGYRNDNMIWWENQSDYSSGAEHTISRDVYVMIGVPSVLDAAGFVGSTGDPEELFSDDFDNNSPNGSNWRISRWSVADQAYQRYGEAGSNDPPDFTPGLGFWVIQNVTDNCTLDISAAQTSGTGQVPQNAYYSVTLEASNGANRGLNMVANPFQYNYDWTTTLIDDDGNPATNVTLAQAVTNGWINGNRYMWDPTAGVSGQYVTIAHTSTTQKWISPWEGFWVEQTDDSKSLDVLFTPEGYAGLLTGTEDDDFDGWVLQLPVRSTDGDYLDTYNSIGISSDYEDGYDGWDAFEFTPMSSEYVQMYFSHPEWERNVEKYTFDLRSDSFDGPKVWDFTVRVSNLPNREFSISWPQISDIDGQYAITLEDPETGQVLADMRAVDEFIFSSGDSNNELINFRIEVVENLAGVADETPSGLAHQFGIVSTYPNPFNNQVRLTYGIERINDVSLKVYDILGREVTVLKRGLENAGTYTVIWRADRQASGVYFVRLEAGGKVDTRKITLLR